MNPCPLVGFERIELRCIACSALNMILISDVQAHHYRSVLLKKDQPLLRILSSVLKLEGLEHCDKLLQLKLLMEACALIYTLCSDNRVKSKYRQTLPDTNGLFTLHGIGTGTGTWNWTSTIGDNGSWFLSLSWTSVNISVQHISTRWFHSPYLSRSSCRAV